MTVFFVRQADSTSGSHETYFPVAIFLKCEILIPVGSKTASRGKLGTDSWVVTCHQEHIDNLTKEK